MSGKFIRAYALTLCVLAFAIIPLRHAGIVFQDPTPCVRMNLPEHVGFWRGKGIRFCANTSCQKKYSFPPSSPPERCSVCGSALSDMAQAERDLLPADTELRRMEYEAPDGTTLAVTIVLSGRERSSIHRPEVCLNGDGSEIIASEVIKVPLENRAQLDVRMLTRRLGHGSGITYAFFAYWFMSNGRETSSHYQRMYWMAIDRIFRGVNRRWAYISLSGHLTGNVEADRQLLRRFVQDLYPQVRMKTDQGE